MGKGQQWLADQLGVSRNAVSLWETNANGILLDHLLKICSLLNLSPNDFRNEDFGSGEVITEHSSDMIVEGEVRAGAWLEIDDGHVSSEWIPFSKDPLYSHARQYALKVVGQSVNKFAAHGTYVIVASWEEIGSDLKDGDFVVVRRARGQTYEVTLKKARKTKAGWQLWPESTDPKHQEPITWHSSNEESEASVIGKVIGKYERV